MRYSMNPMHKEEGGIEMTVGEAIKGGLRLITASRRNPWIETIMTGLFLIRMGEGTMETMVVIS